MRVALVKQALDVFGPWASVKWDGADPARIFDVWPGKATLWSMTCVLKADWFVVPQVVETDYLRDLGTRQPRLRAISAQHVKNVVTPDRIPFDEYDLVITFDPILTKFNAPHTVFAYYLNEHWDALYEPSLRQPVVGYDLFLAHMMDAREAVTVLPQAIAFPYLYSPEIARSTFNTVKEDVAWIDWRTLTTLGMTDVWGKEAERAAERLERTLGRGVRYCGEFSAAPYGLSDPPRWRDAATFLNRVSRSKYYISVGRDSGAGQGLCEAASLGSVCIGERDKVYHRLLCHPDCLCEDMVDMPAMFKRVVASPPLQQAALHWQDEALRIHFRERPVALLHEAIRNKRDHAVSGVAGCLSTS